MLAFNPMEAKHAFTKSAAPLSGLLLIIFFSLATAQCTRRKEVPPYYYIMLPYLVGGGQRPSPPGNVTWTYSPALEQARIRWTPGSDDFLPAPAYRVYLYFSAPPSEFYLYKDLYFEVVQQELYFNIDGVEDPFYAVVTTYDGWSESIPAPYITIRRTDPDHWENP